eukprot:1968724-Alexandrium_andersonii.AAC.1
MPRVAFNGVRRQTLAPRSFPFNACVARPVGKAEIARAPAAQEAAKKECDRLRGKYVWGEANPVNGETWLRTRVGARRLRTWGSCP